MKAIMIDSLIEDLKELGFLEELTISKIPMDSKITIYDDISKKCILEETKHDTDGDFFCQLPFGLSIFIIIVTKTGIKYTANHNFAKGSKKHRCDLKSGNFTRV